MREWPLPTKPQGAHTFVMPIWLDNYQSVTNLLHIEWVCGRKGSEKWR